MATRISERRNQDIERGRVTCYFQLTASVRFDPPRNATPDQIEYSFQSWREKVIEDLIDYCEAEANKFVEVV